MPSITTSYSNAHAVTQGTANPAAAPAQCTVSTDGEGNIVGDAAGAVTLLAYQSGSQSPTNAGAQFSTAAVRYLAVDVTVTSFTGGTTPSMNFFIDRLGADGVWYQMLSISNVGAGGTQTFDLGPGFASTGGPNGSQHAVLTGTARLRWSATGSPTAVVLSASVVGRA